MIQKIPGAGHGAGGLSTEKMQAAIEAFFGKHLHLRSEGKEKTTPNQGSSQGDEARHSSSG